MTGVEVTVGKSEVGMHPTSIRQPAKADMTFIVIYYRGSTPE